MKRDGKQQPKVAIRVTIDGQTWTTTLDGRLVELPAKGGK